MHVEGVLAWARAHLDADPHAARTGDETYRIHSVYLDTADLAVYRRRPGYQNSKFRIRRYGDEGAIHLEEKRKEQDWVTKVRNRIPEAELSWLEATEIPDGWAGAWFRQALEERRLIPTCQVAYRRLAREGETEGGPVRLTLDREVFCAPATGLRPSWEGITPVPLDVTILELKFRHRLPGLFQDLIRSFQLEAAPASKYRRAAEECAPALITPPRD